MIRINRDIVLDGKEVQESFVRAGGAGGQNVNKVSTAVELRFDVARSPSLPEEVRLRLLRMAGKRLTEEGVLVIRAQRFRTQHRNRQDAMERLASWIRRAAQPPPVPRRQTRPTAASRERRLEEKRRRGSLKRQRSPVSGRRCGDDL